MSIPSSLRFLKDALLLDTAEGRDLTRLGQNYGVPRPTFSSVSDDLFREVVSILAYQPKQVIKIMHDLLEVFLGSAGWAMYEIRPNEIIIEMSASDLLFDGDDRSATYLQQNLTPPTSNVSVNVTPGDSFVTIDPYAGFADPAVTLKDEYLVVGGPTQKEWFPYDSIVPTAGSEAQMTHSTLKVKKNYLVGTEVKQFITEPFTSSYKGDYFGVSVKLGYLAAPIAPLDTTATLNAGHALPSNSYLWFDEGAPAIREKRYCTVLGNTITIIDAYNPTFSYAHAISGEVKYYDRLASFNEDSLILTDNNPICLFSNGLLTSFLEYMRLAKASGVQITIKKVG